MDLLIQEVYFFLKLLPTKELFHPPIPQQHNNTFFAHSECFGRDWRRYSLLRPFGLWFRFGLFVLITITFFLFIFLLYIFLLFIFLLIIINYLLNNLGPRRQVQESLKELHQLFHQQLLQAWPLTMVKSFWGCSCMKKKEHPTVLPFVPIIKQS